MVRLLHEKNIDINDLEHLYLSKDHSPYENRLEALEKAIRASDHVVTAWEDERLVGIIRSSGDMGFVQYISDLLVHPDYKSRGLASKLMSAYLEAAAGVDRIYLIMDVRPTSTFTRDWLIYNGFRVVMEEKESAIYMKTNKEADT